MALWRPQELLLGTRGERQDVVDAIAKARGNEEANFLTGGDNA